MKRSLNLEFQYGDKIIANAYFNWYGYPIKSLEILLNI